jgi:hypothetical protein
MPNSVLDKLYAVIHEIDDAGHANPTRLTVLKKWFQQPGRLPAFGLWVAGQAASRVDKATGTAAELFHEARTLLKGEEMTPTVPDLVAAKDLHARLRAYQNTYQRQRWGPVRVVENWDLLLLEGGLAIYLWHQNSPSDGYRLAVKYCEHYDPRYGQDLNGPSRDRLAEIMHFIQDVEVQERGSHE